MENQAVFLDCPAYLGSVMKCQRDDSPTVARPTDTASYPRHATGESRPFEQGVPMSQLTSPPTDPTIPRTDVGSDLATTPCPEVIGGDRAVRCGLPAEVEERYSVGSTDGPLEGIRIRCPRGHWFNGLIESLTTPGQPATAGVSAPYLPPLYPVGARGRTECTSSHV
jgi:hypothetical protein